MISLRDIQSAWYRIWFRPVSPAPLCLFRIAFGVIVAVSAVVSLDSAAAMYGKDGIVSIATVNAYRDVESPISLFTLIEPTEGVVRTTILALAVASVGVAIGFRTRMCAFVVWFLLLSLRCRNPLILNCGDDFIQVAAFLLMFGPSGARYSLDALKADKRLYEPWVQRLLQLQVAVVYISALSYKTGKLWWNGTAVYYVLHSKLYMRGTGLDIFNQLWFTKMATWATLGIEFALFSLIWVKELRYPVLVAGCLLHGALLFTTHLYALQLVMMAAYLCFVRPEDIEFLSDKLHSVFRKPAKTLWRVMDKERVPQ